MVLHLTFDDGPSPASTPVVPTGGARPTPSPVAPGGAAAVGPARARPHRA